MIIDVHGHLSPPSSASKYPMPPSLTDVEGMLAARRRAGIDLTVLGSPVGAGAMMRVPGVDNYHQSADQLRAFHDWLSGLVDEHPEQLRAYVYLDPLGGPAQLRAAQETLDNPAFVGLIINSSIAGRYLDDPRADDFFAFAAQSRLPVLVHPPAEPVGGPAVTDMRFVEQICRFCDVTAGLAMIAYAGWLRKYPQLRIIGATGGGAVAGLITRLDRAAQPRPGAPRPDPATSGQRLPPPIDAGQDLLTLMVDTAISSATQLLHNVEVLGADRVLFGTDSPPSAAPLELAVQAIRQLPIGIADQDAILGGNAAQLFGLDPVEPAHELARLGH